MYKMPIFANNGNIGDFFMSDNKISKKKTLVQKRIRRNIEKICNNKTKEDKLIKYKNYGCSKKKFRRNW